MPYRYFSPDSDPLMVGVKEHVMLMLDTAHALYPHIPYIITCGLRTPEQNCQLKGAVAGSAHETGLAVDLECPDDHRLFCMIDGLIHAGFTRIGVYLVKNPDDPTKYLPKHIHADADEQKPQEVLWVYAEQN